jgi:hypothetical protein
MITSLLVPLRPRRWPGRSQCRIQRGRIGQEPLEAEDRNAVHIYRRGRLRAVRGDLFREAPADLAKGRVRLRRGCNCRIPRRGLCGLIVGHRVLLMATPSALLENSQEQQKRHDALPPQAACFQKAFRW